MPSGDSRVATPNVSATDGVKRRANGSPTNRVLTRRSHGPAGHKEAVYRLRQARAIAARRKRSWGLFVDDGLTFEQIGTRLGVSNYTAFKDVVAYRDGLVAQGLLDAEVMRARQQVNLDAIRRTHMPKRGQKASADVLLRTFEREARLNGLDRQRDTGPTTEAILAVLRSIRDDLLARYPAAEDRLFIQEAFRRRIGAGEATEARPTRPDAVEPAGAPHAPPEESNKTDGS